jgi:hypothetical protein
MYLPPNYDRAQDLWNEGRQIVVGAETESRRTVSPIKFPNLRATIEWDLVNRRCRPGPVRATTYGHPSTLTDETSSDIHVLSRLLRSLGLASRYGFPVFASLPAVLGVQLTFPQAQAIRRDLQQFVRAHVLQRRF